MVNREQGQTTYPNTPETSGRISVERRKFLLGALGISLTGMAAACGSNENRGSSTTTPEYPAETTSETATPTAEAEPLPSPVDVFCQSEYVTKFNSEIQTTFRNYLDSAPNSDYTPELSGVKHMLEHSALSIYLDDEHRQKFTEDIKRRYPLIDDTKAEEVFKNAERDPEIKADFTLYNVMDRTATICNIARSMVETYKESEYEGKAVNIATNILYANLLSDNEHLQPKGKKTLNQYDTELKTYRDQLVSSIISAVEGWRTGNIDSATSLEQRFCRPCAARSTGIGPEGTVPINYIEDYYPEEKTYTKGEGILTAALFPHAIQTERNPSSSPRYGDNESFPQDNGVNDQPSKYTIDEGAAWVPVIVHIYDSNGEDTAVFKYVPYNPSATNLIERDGLGKYATFSM